MSDSLLWVRERLIKVDHDLLQLWTVQHLNTRPTSGSTGASFTQTAFTPRCQPWKLTVTFRILHFLPHYKGKKICLRPQNNSTRPLDLKPGTWFTRDIVIWRWERPLTWQHRPRLKGNDWLSAAACENPIFCTVARVTAEALTAGSEDAGSHGLMRAAPQ